MWYDKLDYRNKINIDKWITFGVEIEFAEARRKLIRTLMTRMYNDDIIDELWNIENDETIYEAFFSTKGGEAISPILRDNEASWHDLKAVCNLIKNYNGVINNNCGAHVHMGANYLHDNVLYYTRFMMLMMLYEDVMVRFWFGERDKPRITFYSHAQSSNYLFNHIFSNYYDNHKLNLSYDELEKALTGNKSHKNQLINFRGISEEYINYKYKKPNNWRDYKTIEFRGGNGTLNESIWQNYVNLNASIFMAVVDEDKNWDFIYNKCDELLNDKAKLFSASNDFNIDKAVEFSDFIFDNSVDKNNFMLQYIKKENCEYNSGKSKIKKR